ncbi:TonB-dependent receptor [Marinifilum fragile]|uniref:SusC/RagA family TonB-linked outer membrane protein n=1 Tax=Marinifilum fragile TaxID=570161 RepID=UPI002AA86FBB|nr:TonB-dependent receptor [Marinifilum fragile]
MKKMIGLFVCLLLIGSQIVNAQSKQVSGTVTSAEDGMGMPGVSVVIKGTTIGASTDIDGKYTLKAEPSDILMFSFVGMVPQEIKVGSQSVINVVMKNESIGLGEVVAVAYGTKTKRAITGAITSVGSEVLENQIAVSPVSAIQGSAPGVNILTSGGQPGENPTIRIRGVGSVNASADPLIVVDGVAFSGNLNSISSSQIETINVLKDASASALYGSRAANGVILITTKGGKYVKKDAKIAVNARAGFSNAAVDLYDYVGAEDYMKYSWESIKNAEIADGATDAVAAATASNNLISTLGYNPYNVANPVDANGEIVSGAELMWDTDWYDALSNDNAFYNEYDLSVSGSSDNVVYFVNGNYLKQEGAILESEFERYSGRVNLKAKLKDWLEIGTNSSFSKSIQNYPNQSGSSYTSIMQWANSIANIYPIYQRDGNGQFKLDDKGEKIYDYGNASGQLVNAVRPRLGGENAVSATLLNDIVYTRSNLFSSTFMKVDLYKDLSFKTNFGYERYIYDSNEYDHYKYGSAASVNGRVSQQRTITETTTITNSLNYRKDFDDHSLAVDLISEHYDYKYDRLTAQGTGFLPGVKVMSGSTVPESVGGYLNSERLESYMARVDYNYLQRYFLDFSVRTDGSSRFHEDERWGTFYSVGANWIMSDEEFMKGADFIDLLKIRSSYGELGNNRGIGYFPYYAAYDTGWNNGPNTGVLQGGVVDEDIKWEKTALFNVALDYGFFNNRITGSLEYYNKESVDLLFDQPLAPSTGNTVISTNIGTVKNTGWEFSVNTVNVHTDDIYWTSTFNISTNKNEITKLPQEEIPMGTKKWMVGKSIYDFFIREYAGVDPQTGEALWYMDSEDEEGVKVTTNDYSKADRYYQGSSLPDWTGGFGTYFKYKNFDLNAQFNFSIGGQLYDYSYAGLMSSLESAGSQLHVDIKDRWQKPGDITDVPKLINANNDYNGTSTRFLFDNDYLRLKALTIGYNVPENFLKKYNISKCRLYFQADNLFTWASLEGLDPEQNLAGTTDSRSNIMKTVSVGVNIEF